MKVNYFYDWFIANEHVSVILINKIIRNRIIVEITLTNVCNTAKLNYINKIWKLTGKLEIKTKSNFCFTS